MGEGGAPPSTHEPPLEVNLHEKDSENTVNRAEIRSGPKQVTKKVRRGPHLKPSPPKIGGTSRQKRGNRFGSIDDPKQLKLKDLWEIKTRQEPDDLHTRKTKNEPKLE